MFTKVICDNLDHKEIRENLQENGDSLVIDHLDDVKNEPLKIMSFVIERNFSTGPDLKYSKDKTKIDIIIKVNNENF